MSGGAGERSKELFERARRSIPGGVNSPVRAFAAVGGEPIFVRRAGGARFDSVDGVSYLDYVLSWGPLLFGHAHPAIVRAAAGALEGGMSYGAPHEGEVTLAEAIRAAVPSIEKARLVSSGTEATMSAVRVARGFTGRDKIVKADGGYHGHADLLLVAAGSGAATLGIPGSAGVTVGAAKDTLLVPYNDAEAVAAVLRGGDVAAVIIEPVAGNMGCVAPRAGYLEALRELCTRHGTVLIFDEVITGFRIARGGAQERYGVTADLTCLGKILGGGLPLAAYGGRADILAKVAPDGPVYQAGTLSGNPVAVAAGLATLELCKDPELYPHLEALGARMEAGMIAAAVAAEVPFTVNRVGSMMTGFFCEGPVTDYATAKHADTKRYARYFREMLAGGVYLAPSQFECAFVSTAHTAADLDLTADLARAAMRTLVSAG